MTTVSNDMRSCIQPVTAADGAPEATKGRVYARVIPPERVDAQARKIHDFVSPHVMDVVEAFEAFRTPNQIWARASAAITSGHVWLVARLLLTLTAVVFIVHLIAS